MKPHLKIVLEDGTEYLDRWHLIPRNDFFNIYLHRTRADDYRVLHDHPWDNLSIILWGGYYESVPSIKQGEGNPFTEGKVIKWRKPGTFVYRKADWPPHSLSLSKGKACWSLFITGKMKRNWGFYTKSGWMAHELLVVVKDGKSQMTKQGLESLL